MGELSHIIDAQMHLKAESDAWKTQRETCVAISKETKVDKMHIYKYKDMRYYYGRGWTESSISKPDPDEKFKDRVSPCFRRLVEIVEILREVGDLKLLEKYLADVAGKGIHIQIDNR